MTQMTTITKKNNYEKIVMHMPKDLDEKGKGLIATTTGEFFMPARLYFRFLNKKALIKALDRRYCIDWEDDNTFIISYWEEAKILDLEVPYDEVPDEVFPVLLAKGSFVSPEEVHVDVRSFERAMGILKFLNKYIGLNFMYATHIATYNRLSEIQGKNTEDIRNLDHNEIFSEAALQQINPEREFSELFAAEKSEDNPEELKKQWKEILEQPIPPLPVVQKFPIKNSRLGLDQLQLSLTLAQFFARACLDKKEDFRFKDMLSLLAKGTEEKEGIY